MNRIDLQFLVLATLLMVAGVVLGIWMGANKDFQLAPVHAHVNLVGWASLALFGLTYRAYPQLAQTRLARAHLLLSAVSACLFPIGIGFAVLRDAPGLAIFASFLWLGGALLFLVQLLGLTRGKAAAETAPVGSAATA